MKNDIDHYRKFTIQELIANSRKFRDYLEFCKKTDNTEEKIIILENLVNYTNEKSTSQQPNTIKILNELTLSCALCIIHSDFEVENFFKISNFSTNFQKNILIQAINECNERFLDHHNSISLKFNFWVLLFYNKSILATSDLNLPNQLSESDYNESINSLLKILEQKEFVNENLINCCKIQYELGVNFYIKDFHREAAKYFGLCKEKFLLIEKKNLLYFDLESLNKLINFCLHPIEFTLNEDKSFSDVQMLSTEKELKSSKILIESNFKVQEYFSPETFNASEAIRYCKNLVDICLKDYSRIKEAKEKISILKEKKLSENVTNDQKLIKKELCFNHHLIEILEKAVFQSEMNLNTYSLHNLSKDILDFKIIDDLEISGRIHCLLINFSNSFKEIFNYFKDYVEYIFEEKNKSFCQLTINQVKFINIFLNILDRHNKNNYCLVEGEIYNQLINLTYFWINSMRVKTIGKKQNIIIILIKSLFNANHLVLLKMILVHMMKLVTEKSNYFGKNNDELQLMISNIESKVFKFQSITNELPSLSFKEEKVDLMIDSSVSEFFIAELIQYLIRIEERLSKFRLLEEIENQKRKVNILFIKYNDPICLKEALKLISLIVNNIKEKYMKIDFLSQFQLIEGIYNELSDYLERSYLLKVVYLLHFNGMSFEAAIFLQYMRKIDYDLAYKLLQANPNSHSFDKLELIWKIPYFEKVRASQHCNKHDQKNEQSPTLQKAFPAEAL